MSAHVEFRCDICATPGHGRFNRLGFGFEVPKGWHRWGSSHLCSYDCLIASIQDAKRDERAKQMLGRDAVAEVAE